jgi:hypothetical protein
MDGNNRFEFRNSSEKAPTIRKSEHPIDKKEIEAGIVDLILKNLPENDYNIFTGQDDFKMEFLCPDESTALIKIHTKYMGKDHNLELKLTGANAKEFVERIDHTKLWQN